MELKMEGSKGTSLVVFDENGKVTDIKLIDRKNENPLYRILGNTTK